MYPIQNLSSFPTKKIVNRIYSFGYSDQNVGGGVKLTPPARFWTFFSLPGIGVKVDLVFVYLELLFSIYYFKITILDTKDFVITM